MRGGSIGEADLGRIELQVFFVFQNVMLNRLLKQSISRQCRQVNIRWRNRMNRFSRNEPSESWMNNETKFEYGWHFYNGADLIEWGYIYPERDIERDRGYNWDEVEEVSGSHKIFLSDTDNQIERERESVRFTEFNSKCWWMAAQRGTSIQ